MLEAVIEVLGALYSRVVGRPWQRRRAERLIRQGKVRSILFEADQGVLHSRSVNGVAEVSEKRLRLQDVDLWVRGIEGPAEAGPIDPFEHDGRFRPTDGNLQFQPPTRIYTLRLHTGATVKWVVLASQANQALALLGFVDRAATLDREVG